MDEEKNVEEATPEVPVEVPAESIPSEPAQETPAQDSDDGEIEPAAKEEGRATI